MNEETGKIWVFDEGKLEEAMALYQHDAIAQYPKQQQRIELTLLAVRDFLDSSQAAKLRMSVKASPQAK